MISCAEHSHRFVSHHRERELHVLAKLSDTPSLIWAIEQTALPRSGEQDWS